MASDAASPDPRSKLHSLVRLSGPFLGADLPPAERRAQVLSRMPLGTGAQRRLVLDQTEHGAMLVQVGPPASSKTATPNHVVPVIPGDRNELLECHSEATRGRSPVSPDRPTKIVLRRSVESAQSVPVTMMTLCRMSFLIFGFVTMPLTGELFKRSQSSTPVNDSVTTEPAAK